MKKYLILPSLILLTACETNDWLGADEVTPLLEGKRISVLEHRIELKEDSGLNKIEVKLPSTVKNKSWTKQNIAPAENLSLAKKLTNDKKSSIGDAPKEGLRLTSTPIIANGNIFTIDGNGNLQSRDAKNIDKLNWESNINNSVESGEKVELAFGIGFGSEKRTKEFLGGNISYVDGKILATTSNGYISSVSAKDGKTLWSRSLNLPIKSAPISDGKRIFAITSGNTVYGLNAKDGKTLWTHASVNEGASVYGVPSPVIEGNIVVVPYSSGDIIAFNAETGQIIWSESLVSKKRKQTSGFVLNDIDATPIIANDVVYAVSNDNVLTAIDLYSGKKLWTQEISSVKTPWKAGEFLYVLTVEDQIIAIHSKTGRIKWIKQLENFEEASLKVLGAKKGARISYFGPILANDRLLLIGSDGFIRAISPFSGTVVERIPALSNVYLPLVVANDIIYLLNNDAEMMSIY